MMMTARIDFYYTMYKKKKEKTTEKNTAWQGSCSKNAIFLKSSF